MRAYFLTHDAPQPVQDARQRILESKQRKLDLEESFPTAMVMVEMPMPRGTFILERGQYDKPAEQVSPGVPAALNPLPESRRAQSAGVCSLARRSEQSADGARGGQSFLAGIFWHGPGQNRRRLWRQGEAPSHPQLLDWLASEFVASGWDVKAMQRLIVTSGTYRQTASARRNFSIAIRTTVCLPGVRGCGCRPK